VTSGRFAEHIHFLAEQGYRAITLSEAVSALRMPNTQTQPLVAITFDDGYRDFMNNAWPILHDARMTATVFLPTAWIDEPRLRMAVRACLTWNEVRELADSGVEFGSHTVSHPHLSDLPLDQVAFELMESKHKIEQQLGRPCRGFSYPYAFPSANSRFRSFLHETQLRAGYEWGVTTTVGRAGTACDCLTYPRIPVNDYDTTRLLDAKLMGAYDWIRQVQNGVKTIRYWISRERGCRFRAQPL
jgi:peptidoglycan/xylan/chitin deacetylase (PgdA/CDA1 family)